MRHRTPKDLDKYIPAWLAASRLISFALEAILCCRSGVRVKWQLSVHYYYPEDVVKGCKAVALPMGGKVSSGTYERGEKA